MTVDINTVVSLHYKLKNHITGEQIEETSAEHPMQFLYGIERIIPQFEEGIFGKAAGEKFDFVITSDNAYGAPATEHIVQIPVHVFHDKTGKMDEEAIFVGAVLPMSDNEGNHMRGTVLEITPEAVKMDFNHPLAGVDLQFEGEIIAVRAATQDEISHGHSHGEHGHHH